MLTITGKNTITATTIIFESGLVIVNHWFMIGAKAMMGMALATVAMGTRPCRIETQRPAARATATPSTTPISSPPTASIRVRSPAPQMIEKFSDESGGDLAGLRQHEGLHVEQADQTLPRNQHGDEGDRGRQVSDRRPGHDEASRNGGPVTTPVRTAQRLAHLGDRLEEPLVLACVVVAWLGPTRPRRRAISGRAAAT